MEGQDPAADDGAGPLCSGGSRTAMQQQQQLARRSSRRPEDDATEQGLDALMQPAPLAQSVLQGLQATPRLTIARAITPGTGVGDHGKRPPSLRATPSGVGSLAASTAGSTPAASASATPRHALLTSTSTPAANASAGPSRAPLSAPDTGVAPMADQPTPDHPAAKYKQVVYDLRGKTTVKHESALYDQVMRELEQMALGMPVVHVVATSLLPKEADGWWAINDETTAVEVEVAALLELCDEENIYLGDREYVAKAMELGLGDALDKLGALEGGTICPQILVCAARAASTGHGVQAHQIFNGNKVEWSRFGYLVARGQAAGLVYRELQQAADRPGASDAVKAMAKARRGALSTSGRSGGTERWEQYKQKEMAAAAPGATPEVQQTYKMARENAAKPAEAAQESMASALGKPRGGVFGGAMPKGGTAAANSAAQGSEQQQQLQQHNTQAYNQQQSAYGVAAATKTNGQLQAQDKEEEALQHKFVRDYAALNPGPLRAGVPTIGWKPQGSHRAGIAKELRDEARSEPPGGWARRVVLDKTDAQLEAWAKLQFNNFAKDGANLVTNTYTGRGRKD